MRLRRTFPLVLLAAALASAQSRVVRRGEFNGRTVNYQVIDGLAIYEGDIILGTAEEPRDGRRDASFTTGSLWPGGWIPYEIDPAIPAATLSRVQAAIDAWNGYDTPIRLQPRAGETAYVRFARKTTPPVGACFSNVGRTGGQQSISVEDSCGTVTLIHEIGHTVGLFHEQSRRDRNRHVTVLWENVAKTLASNFNEVASGQDLGGYEYASNMHYSLTTFSSNGGQVLETVPPGIPIAEVSGMSPGDLDAVNRKYGVVPSQITITANPPGLNVLVDGATVATPYTVSWAGGTQHTLAVPEEPQSLGGRRYVFGRWSDEQPQSHTITVSQSVTIYTANFIRKVPVTISAAAGGAARADSPPEDGHYTANTQIRLFASPAAGWRFYRWVSTGRRCPVVGLSSNPAMLPVGTSPAGCEAQFTQQSITTVASDPPGQSVTVDGASYSAPVNFTFAPGSLHTISAVSPSARLGMRLLFDGWSDGGASAHTIAAQQEGGVITARFRTQYLLTLSQPGSTGSLVATPSSADGFYDAGTIVTIQANAAPGRSLNSWGGDLYGRSNPGILVMNSEKLVSATFSTTLPAITVLHSLTARPGAISPGEIVTVWGSNLGPAGGSGALIDAQGKVATLNSGTRILFDGVAAPITYTSAGQVNAVAPYGIAGRTSTNVVAEYLGVAQPGAALTVANASPGIVGNSSGYAVALNEDGTFNGAGHPARRGSVIVFWATGEGLTTPAGVDGRVAVPPYAVPDLPVSVRIGGKVAKVEYAGSAPFFVAGAMQVNARIPEDAPAGDASIYLVVGNFSSPAGLVVAVE
jgi:uncharacterized protein (TIGR03437 family)